MKKLLIIIAIVFLGSVFVVSAAPALQYSRSILPEDDFLWDLGTTTPSNLRWNNIFTKDLTISGTCTGCGGGEVFAWTVFSDRNATSTLLDFQQGFISGASSTVSADFHVFGDVGIGTDSPGFPLDVRSSGFVASFGITNTFEIFADFGGVGEINPGAFMQTGGGDMVFAPDPTVGASTMIAYKEGSNWRSALQIAHTASGFGNLLLMKSGGNVGIGTTTPFAKLSIHDGNLFVGGSIHATSSIKADYSYLFSDGSTQPYGATPDGFGWHVNTLVFKQATTTKSTDVGETVPRGVFFRSDGLKMYVVGGLGDDVHEYDLSIAWDVSTASFLQEFDVSTEENSPFSVFFKPDGFRMYVVGIQDDEVNEYTLTTAWDVTSATPSFTLDTTSEDTNPADIWFKPDGTKMYIISSSNEINEYNFSTPWDLSTAVAFQVLDITSEATFPKGIAFKNDGRKMYMADSLEIHEYDLGTAWNISTALVVRSNIHGQAAATGLFIKPDGTKLYSIDGNPDVVNEYDLGTSINGLSIFQNGFISQASSTISSTLHISNNLSASSTLTVDGRAFFGGNVGIGITNPVATLHIVGTVARIDQTGAGTAWVANRTDGKPVALQSGQNKSKFLFDESGDFAIQSTVASDVLTGTGTGDARLTVLGSNGNIGIASTSPWGLLSVEINATDIVNPAFVVSNQGSTTPAFYIDGSTGRVGIGTDSPGAPLVVQTSDATTEAVIFEFRSQDNRTLQVLQPDTADNNDAFTFATPNAYLFRVDAIDAFFIDSGGKIGIGTTTPSGKLHIATGQSGVSFNTGSDEFIIEGGSGQIGLAFASQDGVQQNILFGDTTSAVAGRIQYFHTGDSMLFATAGTEQMRIDSSGNVGIGTDNPGATLEVVGTLTTSDRITINAATGSITPFLIQLQAGQTGDWNVININANANTSPTAQNAIVWQFDSITTAAGPSINAVRTGAGDTDLIFSATQGDARLEMMRLDGSSGNVGIGTTDPTATLEIGSAGVDGNLYIPGDSVSNGLVFVTDTDSFISTFITNGMGLRTNAANDNGNLDYAFTGKINFNTRDITGSRDLQVTTGAGTVVNMIFFGGSDQSDEGGISFPSINANTGDRETLCVVIGGGSVTRDVASNNCDTSSRRYKHDIQELNIDGFTLINSFKPVSFIKNSDETGREQWGFIAEDMASSSPELALWEVVDSGGKGRLVKHDVQKSRPYSISKYGIMAVLTDAIQKLVGLVTGNTARLETYDTCLVSSATFAEFKTCVAE